MKPIYLELQAFGPFVEKQTVDFEKLSKEGIFLITGKTGSGKTTIFDAMTVALYGGGSGENEKSKTGRNDMEQWRCRQARPELDTFVSFIFEVKGVRYKFARRLIQKPTKLSAKYEAGMYNEDREYIPFFTNPKKDNLNNKAAEIIGLSKDQFRQVVLLPQGQFEQFLTASSGEKEEILKKVFNTARWEKYAEYVFYDALKIHKELDNDKLAIDNSLSEEGLSSVVGLAERIESLKLQKKDCFKAHEAFNGKEKQEELTADRQLFEQFKPLHAFENKVAELEKSHDSYERKKEAYDKAEEAERYRSFIDSFESSLNEYTLRSNALKATENMLPEAEKTLKAAVEKKEEHLKLSPVAALQKKIGEYEAKAPVYASYAELEQKYSSANKEYQAAAAELKKAEEKLQKAVADCAAKLKERNEAEATAAQYRTRYFAGIYGEIAGELKEGEKCPVCGSASHPEPAKKAPDSVSKDDWDAKEKKAESAKKVWESAEEIRTKAEDEKNNKSAAENEKRAAKTSAEAALNAAKQALIDGIADGKALQTAIQGCKNSITEYESKGEKLEKAENSARAAVLDLNAKIETAKSEAKKAKDARDKADSALKAELSKGSYTDYMAVKALLLGAEERTKRHAELVRYENSLQENREQLAAKKEELAGKTEPDNSAFSARQKEITEENDSYNAADAKATAEIQRLERKYAALSFKEANYKERIQQADSDLKFAKALRGDTGMSLQRYILAIMFNKVIDEANRMLKNVHNGRYALRRSDDRGEGNKRGLELNVLDSRSPEDVKGRPVAMLSGGEKFLVSLSLSIGLSTVAQKSGVQIDALFIDEGFGTLDEDSITDALDILNTVRRGSSTIGIISHVTMLESILNSKLEVEKTDGHNRIKPV